MILTHAQSHSASAGDRRIRRQRSFAGTLLVLCLLFAQWVGYAHAIAHWHGQGNAGAHLQKAERIAIADATTGLFDHQKASGACVALDAATLGVSLCSSALTLPAIHQPPLLQAMPAAPFWLPAFSPLFSPRAPPLSA